MSEPMSACVDHGYTSCLNKNGYRRAWHPPTKKLQLLHRVVYVDHNNVTFESIEGLSIRHTCDNPRCINPEHLLSGTHADNMRDRSERGRVASVVGDLNPNSKITHKVAIEIRARAVTGRGGNLKDLARMYSISVASVYDILSGRTWNEQA